jgi:O-antigen/teichoic acid export membrane protein
MSKLKKNLTSNYLAMSIALSKRFLYVYLFTKFLDVDTYGEWILTISLVSFFPLAQLGMDLFSLNKLSELYHRNEYKKYNKYLTSQLLASTIILLLFAFVVFIFIFIFDGVQFLPMENHINSKLVLALMSLYFLLMIPFKIVHNIYQTVGKFSRGRAYLIIEELIQIALVIWLLIFFESLVYIAYAHIFSLVLITIVMSLDIKQIAPEVSLNYYSKMLVEWKQDLRQGMKFLYMQIANMSVTHLPNIIIGFLDSISSVVVFSTHRVLSYATRAFVQTQNTGLWPTINSLYLERDMTKLVSLISLNTKVVFFISFTVNLLLFITLSPLISVWTNSSVHADYLLFFIMTTVTLSQSIWRSLGLLQMATNNHNKISHYEIYGAIFGLIFGSILTYYFGILGMSLGILIADILFCTFNISSASIKMFPNAIRGVFSDMIYRTILSTTSILIIYIFTVKYQSIFQALIILPFVAVSFFYILLSNQDRKMVLLLLRKRI